MRHGYLLGYQHIKSLCLLLPVCGSASPSVLPGAQRCWPRAPAEFRGIGVEVNATASLRVSQNVQLGAVFCLIFCTPNFDQFRPLQHLKVGVQASVENLQTANLKRITSSVDETLLITTRYLQGTNQPKVQTQRVKNGGCFCSDQTS